MTLPLTLNVDEIGVLPQVSSIEELRDAPFSCFTEVLPHRQGAVAALFPGSSSHHAGEIAAPDWWSDTEAELRVLHLFKIRDAFVFPGWGVVVDREGRVMRLTMEEAAYASADLTALPHVERRDGSVVFDIPEPIERAAKVAVTLPSGARENYGHFVLDCLPGIATIDDSGVFGDFARVVPPLKPWQRRHFDLLGARPQETDASVLMADEVIYTSAVHHFLQTPNLTYRTVRSRQLARVADRPATAGRGLYVARGARNQRIMRSEPRLIHALALAGCEAIDPERMSVDEQIARFASAEVVIGSAGAALANVLYCSPGSTVIEIHPLGMENPWVQSLCFINGLHYAAWFCGAVAADPQHPERQLSYDIDVVRFLEFVFARSRLKQASGWRSRLARLFKAAR